MLSKWRIPYRGVQFYMWLWTVCAFLGNNFLEFSFLGWPFNPYRLVGLAAPLILLSAPCHFWKTLCKGGARWYAAWVVLLFVYALLSVCWLPVSARSLWITYSLFLVYGTLHTLLLIGSLDSRTSLIRVLKLFEICAVVVSIGALIEILTRQYWFNECYVRFYLWGAEKSFMHLPYPVFSMGNVNDYGVYLFMALVAVCWLIKDDRSRCKKWHYAAGFLFLFLILCTQSRSVFLALIIALAVAGACYLLQKPPHWKLWLGTACGLLLVAVIGFVRFWLYDSPADKVGNSDDVRMGLIRNAWWFFKPVWYRGLGWGGIDYHNIQYPICLVDDVPNLHNWFLEILFSGGVGVFALYLWVYIKTVWQAWGKVRVEGRLNQGCRSVSGASWQAMLILASLAAFVALSLASSSLVPSQWFWAVGGIGFAAAGLCLEAGLNDRGKADV